MYDYKNVSDVSNIFEKNVLEYFFCHIVEVTARQSHVFYDAFEGATCCQKNYENCSGHFEQSVLFILLASQTLLMQFLLNEGAYLRG